MKNRKKIKPANSSPSNLDASWHISISKIPLSQKQITNYSYIESWAQLKKDPPFNTEVSWNLQFYIKRWNER